MGSYAGYWAASDMAQYLPQLTYGVDLVTASSTPVNASQLQYQIQVISAEVDAAMNRGGWLPPVPSGATAWTQVQSIVLQGVAAWLFNRIPGAQPKADEYSKAYADLLAQLGDGSFALLDMSRDPTEAGRGLPRGGSQSNREHHQLRVKHHW